MVQDRARRRDRIGAEEHRQAGELASGHQAERDRLAAGHRAVKTRRHFRGRYPDLLERPADFSGLPISVSGIQRRDIGFDQLVALCTEFRLQRLDQGSPVAIEHPQRQTERPHRLAAKRFAIAQPKRLNGLQGQTGDIEGNHPIRRETEVLQRIARVTRLFQIALIECPGVRNDQTAGAKRGQIHFERRRIHRHQHIGSVAGRVDRCRSEIDLECRHAKGRALRRPDLRREVGKGGEIVAGERGRQRELTASQLDAISRIAGKTHHDSFWR